MLCAVFFAKGQYPGVPQSFGGPKIATLIRGGLFVDSTFALPVFDDTASANRSNLIKMYKGALIRTRNPANTVWMRDSTLRYWFVFCTVSPSLISDNGHPQLFTNFPSDITSTSNINQLNDSLGTGITKTFSGGLILSGTTSRELQYSTLKYKNYGLVGNQNFIQYLYYKVIDTTTPLSIGIGLKSETAP